LHQGKKNNNKKCEHHSLKRSASGANQKQCVSKSFTKSILINSMSDGSSMCDAGFGLSLACAACITYAWCGWLPFMRACLRVAASAKAGGQKTFLLHLHRLTQITH